MEKIMNDFGTDWSPDSEIGREINCKRRGDKYSGNTEIHQRRRSKYIGHSIIELRNKDD